MTAEQAARLTFGSLFAGIGGFDLGFERAGMTCKWQVEIDDYATRVLAKHWPHVHRERDIRECGKHNIEPVDVICGGFPCQDISYAGLGAGLDGERSGLFFEAIRVVRELRPRIVVLENVAALLTRGLDRVLGTLAEIGFDAEWHCIPAAAVGAPHIRDRVFIIAHTQRDGRATRSGVEKHQEEPRQRWGESPGSSQILADSQCPERRQKPETRESRPDRDDRGWQETTGRSPNGRQDVADADIQGSQGWISPELPECPGEWAPRESNSCPMENADQHLTTKGWVQGTRKFMRAGCDQTADSARGLHCNWITEPDVGRVAHGVPARVDRLRGLGNAVVPQVAEWIGRRIVEAMQ